MGKPQTSKQVELKPPAEMTPPAIAQKDDEVEMVFLVKRVKGRQLFSLHTRVIVGDTVVERKDLGVEDTKEITLAKAWELLRDSAQ